MKRRLTLVPCVALGLLTACSAMRAPSDADALQVTVAGDVFIIQQLTESTWTASSSRFTKPVSAAPASVALLRQAIEKASGCKVTDSDFSLQGRQFDAQVDCASRRND